METLQQGGQMQQIKIQDMSLESYGHPLKTFKPKEALFYQATLQQGKPARTE